MQYGFNNEQRLMGGRPDPVVHFGSQMAQDLKILFQALLHPAEAVHLPYVFNQFQASIDLRCGSDAKALCMDNKSP